VFYEADENLGSLLTIQRGLVRLWGASKHWGSPVRFWEACEHAQPLMGEGNVLWVGFPSICMFILSFG